MINKIIKFSAQWCGPCKTMDASLKEYATKTGMNVESYDVEENVDLTAEFKVRSVPTVFFMQDDEIIDRKGGTMTPKQIEEHINKLNSDIFSN